MTMADHKDNLRVQPDSRLDTGLLCDVTLIAGIDGTE